MFSVKEVPDAAVRKRTDPASGRLDRSGERTLNPYDTHAIEAAMQIKEGGVVPVEEIVAVTMGPPSAQRALHKAVSLGADRSLHLCDDALAGSDVAVPATRSRRRWSASSPTSYCSASSPMTASVTPWVRLSPITCGCRR